MVSAISSNNFQQNNSFMRSDPVMESIRTNMDAKLAEKTGLSTEELQESQKNGTFFQVLQDAGITSEDMSTIRTEVLSEMVESGEITQEQADNITERMESRPPGPPPGGGMKASSEDEELISWIKQLSETSDDETVKEMLQNLISQKTQDTGNSNVTGMLLDYFL